MSRTIKTYDDLIEEKERLTSLLAVQRLTVSDHWTSLKSELEPVNHAFGTLGKIAKGDKSNPLVNIGLQFVGDMFIKNFVLAKAGWLTRMTVPFVMKNYSSHLLADKGKNLVNKLGQFLKRNQNGHHISNENPDDYLNR